MIELEEYFINSNAEAFFKSKHPQYKIKIVSIISYEKYEN